MLISHDHCARKPFIETILKCHSRLCPILWNTALSAVVGTGFEICCGVHGVSILLQGNVMDTGSTQTRRETSSSTFPSPRRISRFGMETQSDYSVPLTRTNPGGNEAVLATPHPFRVSLRPELTVRSIAG